MTMSLLSMNVTTISWTCGLKNANQNKDDNNQNKQQRCTRWFHLPCKSIGGLSATSIPAKSVQNRMSESHHNMCHADPTRFWSRFRSNQWGKVKSWLEFSLSNKEQLFTCACIKKSPRPHWDCKENVHILFAYLCKGMPKRWQKIKECRGFQTFLNAHSNFQIMDLEVAFGTRSRMGEICGNQCQIP